MEDTEAKAAPVHVLRHTFRPSEQLRVAVDNFMKSGVTRPRFLYASRTVAVDFSRHDIQQINPLIDRAQGIFLRHGRDAIQLGGQFEQSGRRVLAKALNNGTLRVGFMPNNTELFEELLAPLRDIPNDIGGLALRSAYVYADIKKEDRAPDSYIEDQLFQLNRVLSNSSQHRLYTIQPSGIERRPR